MAIDFNKPVTTDNYSTLLTNLRDMQAALAKIDYAGASNIPTDAIRWNGTNSVFEKYNGSTWDTLFDFVSVQNAIRDYFSFAVTTGSTNAYVLTLPTAPSSLVDGMRVRIRANFTNTGAATLNANSLGATDIEMPNGLALVGGEIASGRECELIYRSAAAAWILVKFDPTWVSYTPTYTASGSMTFTSVTTTHAQFLRKSAETLSISVRAQGTVGGTPNDRINASLPGSLTCGLNAQLLPALYRDAASGGGASPTLAFTTTANPVIQVFKPDASNWTAGVDRIISFNGEIRIS